MITIRDFRYEDDTALQTAIDADTFHPGQWKTEHFHIPGTLVKIIEDGIGPVAYVLYTPDALQGSPVLRVSCVWADCSDTRRNARAIIHGLRDAADKARTGGLTGVVVETEYDKLAYFFMKIMGMVRIGNDYILPVKDNKNVRTQFSS